VKILFAKTELAASKIIMRLTGEDCSHCAVGWGDYVIHSDFLGVRSISLEQFLQSHTIVHALEFPDEVSQLLATFAKYDRSLYDFGAFFYVGLRLIFPALPKKNLWRTSGMFLCTEWVETVLGLDLDPMMTPYKLYLQLQEKAPRA
jgi:hypothetical protein